MPLFQDCKSLYSVPPDCKSGGAGGRSRRLLYSFHIHYSYIAVNFWFYFKRICFIEQC